MKAHDDGDVLREAQDFSLVLGGPLYQLLRRAHLTDDALTTLRRRVLVITLVAWAPLLALSLYEGAALGPSLEVPFLLDPEVNVRFLISLPLLVIAELIVHQRTRLIVGGFLERNLLAGEDQARFRRILESSIRLRNSVVAEVLLVLLVYGLGVMVIFRYYFVLPAHTWYGTPGAGGHELSLAGLWYGYVSLPIYQFLLVRWYFRLFIWARFLWHAAWIPLRLAPLHPDRLGGLGFVSNTVDAVVPLAVAMGAVAAGNLANRILFAGAHLRDFRFEILGVVGVVCCLVLGPLLFFMPQLAQARRTGLREYGNLAERYVRDFDQKWLRGGAPADEPLVGSGDIQSLADLGNSYEVVRGMRISPVTREAVLRLSLATLAPFVPLALTIMPLEDLLKQLFNLLF